MPQLVKHAVLASLVLLGIAAAARRREAGGAESVEASRVALLSRTLVPIEEPRQLSLPTLVDHRGEAFGAERLRGRWSLVFFGFTSCPDVCPTTLQLMSRVAADPGSRVGTGDTQLLFVTVDPQTDTPQQLREHLRHFDARIRGLSGNADEVTQFTEVVGAAASAMGSRFDHSTSLFAIDPEGRLAGVLLNPAQPAQIAADLAALRAAYVGRGGRGG